jgi:hypothetical protein
MKLRNIETKSAFGRKQTSGYLPNLDRRSLSPSRPRGSNTRPWSCLGCSFSRCRLAVWLRTSGHAGVHRRKAAEAAKANASLAST